MKEFYFPSYPSEKIVLSFAYKCFIILSSHQCESFSISRPAQFSSTWYHHVLQPFSLQNIFPGRPSVWLRTAASNVFSLLFLGDYSNIGDKSIFWSQKPRNRTTIAPPQQSQSEDFILLYRIYFNEFEAGIFHALWFTQCLSR